MTKMFLGEGNEWAIVSDAAEVWNKQGIEEYNHQI